MEVRAARGMLSLMSTGSGLLFGGDVNGHFRAYDQKTGQILWDVNLGAPVNGYPAAFAVGGKQYIAVSTGGSASRSVSAAWRRSFTRGPATSSSCSHCRSRLRRYQRGTVFRFRLRSGGRKHMTTTQTPEVSRNGLLTAFGAMVGLALGPSVIANLTVTAYITPIEKELGWSRVDVSFAFTIVAYMIVLMSPLQGLLVDRFGSRRVVLTSIPLFALSLAAIYYTPANIYVYYLLWSLVPIAAIGLWPLGYLQAVTPWFDRKLGLALGCANAGIGVGSTLLPMLVLGPMIRAYGWRSAVLTLAGSCSS